MAKPCHCQEKHPYLSYCARVIIIHAFPEKKSVAECSKSVFKTHVFYFIIRKLLASNDSIQMIVAKDIKVIAEKIRLVRPERDIFVDILVHISITLILIL